MRGILAACGVKFLGSDCKPLRGCVTGRNFWQVSLLSSVGAASHAAREGAVRRRLYNKRILSPLPLGERGRVRGILPASQGKFLDKGRLGGVEFGLLAYQITYLSLVVTWKQWIRTSWRSSNDPERSSFPRIAASCPILPQPAVGWFRPPPGI